MVYNNNIVGKSSICHHDFNINIELSIYGNGKVDINTGIGFLNHMLELIAKHASFDLRINCDSDLSIDDHHTIDEIGMNLGLAFRDALSKISLPIQRFGYFILPMDEVMTTVAVDTKAARSSFVYDVKFFNSTIGSLATESIREFWSMFAQKSEINLIIKSEYGINDHHISEGLFKCVAHALKMSIKTLEVKNEN